MIDDKTLEKMLNRPIETKEQYLARLAKMYGQKAADEARETATDQGDWELTVDLETRAEFIRLWCVPSDGFSRMADCAFRSHMKWCREQAVKNAEAKGNRRPIE